ncbi:MAG: homoserine kinase [Gammaproteobacteria bacterium]|nr:homoserine kinase [Gammaproteobacteria bacterium]
MSVYTLVGETDLKRCLQDYQAGELLSYTGIRDGIENTNYFVTTDKGEYVLTIFEYIGEDDAQYSLDLMQHLASQGLPCPMPHHDSQGQSLYRIHDKPACLVSRLCGQSPAEINSRHCSAIGDVLARFHLASQSMKSHRPNNRNATWRHTTAERLQAFLNPEQKTLLADELLFQETDLSHLPQGHIHADLFQDNTLFQQNQLSGLLDLYDACHDIYLYDLAITATDWCSHENGEFDPVRLQSLLDGYTAIRPISSDEQAAWPVLLRRAALRFWLSRLKSRHFPNEGHLTQEKDPQVYHRLLQHYRISPQMWPG